MLLKGAFVDVCLVDAGIFEVVSEREKYCEKFTLIYIGTTVIKEIAFTQSGEHRGIPRLSGHGRSHGLHLPCSI